MNLLIKKYLKFVILYIAQTGAIWSLLEGYTYFKGDALKVFLGSYWVFTYIIPVFTTTYILLREVNEENVVQENIRTLGDFSPGKVDGNYAVRKQLGKLNPKNSSDQILEDKQPDIQTEKQVKSIRTNGDYSPGEVGGDYTVEE